MKISIYKKNLQTSVALLMVSLLHGAMSCSEDFSQGAPRIPELSAMVTSNHTPSKLLAVEIPNRISERKLAHCHSLKVIKNEAYKDIRAKLKMGVGFILFSGCLVFIKGVSGGCKNN